MISKQYRDKLMEYKGQLSTYQKLFDNETIKNIKLTQDALDAEMASDIITLVALQTQEKLSFKIENLVTAGLQFVFDDPYAFKVEFDTKNNRTQCELFFERDGMKIDPIKDSSGGSLDISSQALRFAMWSLQPNRNSPVFILDECGKHLSTDLRERAAMFLKEMCDKLHIQIISVSHDESLVETSDSIIRVYKDGIYSEVA